MRTAQRLIHVRLPDDRQKNGEEKVGRLSKSMSGTLDASQHDHANLFCGESGGFRIGKHSAALFHKSNTDVRMFVRGFDLVFV